MHTPQVTIVFATCVFGFQPAYMPVELIAHADWLRKDLT